MRIAMIGSGYVGLVSGACFADFGHVVTCVDRDVSRIEALKRGQSPIFEPGLPEMVESNVRQNRLFFTTELVSAVASADAVFIAVGTPSRRGDGHADLSYVYGAAREIAAALSGYFKRPDRIIVGAEDERSREVMQEVYRPLYLNQPPIMFTGRRTSELTKYAANAFLATKITFINEIADLCEKLGANVQEVARGIGLDNRIGSKFLHAGPGYGGSCFPKDTLALVRTAQEAGSPVRIVETVAAANELRKRRMADKVLDACGGSVTGKTIAVLGLAFKPNTDDMRAAPSLAIIPALQSLGASVRAFDPESMAQARPLLPGVTFCDEPYSCIEGADALVIVTEWDAFRALDLDRVKASLAEPVVVDLRNIYRPAEMARKGFRYVSVGRP